MTTALIDRLQPCSKEVAEFRWTVVVFDGSKNVVVVGLAGGDDGCVMRQSNALRFSPLVTFASFSFSSSIGATNDSRYDRHWCKQLHGSNGLSGPVRFGHLRYGLMNSNARQYEKQCKANRPNDLMEELLKPSMKTMSKAYFGVDYVRDADSNDDEEEDEDDSAHADVDPQSISTSVGGEVLQALAYDIQIPVYKTKNTIHYLSEHEENMKRNKLVSPKTGTITIDNASLSQVQHTPDREQSGSPVRSLSSPMAAA
ncbi:hypothetical protein E3N88_25961 [Mikania micrantha]|uniref:Uncharacterized protein n=1 Tax=Mikania micrantha TaxID=192012 RepID=A0A5N6N769_9ASTR|nr:hypothetical protein E3N88_25961 [Mikania micrantha]